MHIFLIFVKSFREKLSFLVHTVVFWVQSANANRLMRTKPHGVVFTRSDIEKGGALSGARVNHQ